MDCLRTKKWKLVKLNLERIQQGEIVKPNCSMLWSLWIVQVLTAQSCPTLCNPINCNPPGSSVHGNLQARTLEWRAVPFSRESSRPSDQTQTSCFACGFLTIEHQGGPEVCKHPKKCLPQYLFSNSLWEKREKCFKFTES